MNKREKKSKKRSVAFSFCENKTNDSILNINLKNLVKLNKYIYFLTQFFFFN